MQRTWPQSDPDKPEEPPRRLPPELLRPTYQNRLRLIGRHLDVGGFRTVVVLEVDGGFVARAVSRSDRELQLLEFLDETFPERMIQATESRGAGERGSKGSPIAPTGYEDLFRALGRQADLRKLARISIAEMTDGLVLAGDDCAAEIARPVDFRLSQDAISRLLDDAFRQRGQTPESREV